MKKNQLISPFSNTFYTAQNISANATLSNLYDISNHSTDASITLGSLVGSHEINKSYASETLLGNSITGVKLNESNSNYYDGRSGTDTAFQRLKWFLQDSIKWFIVRNYLSKFFEEANAREKVKLAEFLRYSHEQYLIY